MLVDQFKAIQLVRDHTRNSALAELGKAPGNHLRHNTATMCKHDEKLIHCQVCRQQSLLFLRWHFPNVDVPIRPSGGLLHAPHNGLGRFATPDAARTGERPLPLDWATTGEGDSEHCSVFKGGVEILCPAILGISAGGSSLTPFWYGPTAPHAYPTVH